MKKITLFLFALFFCATIGFSQNEYILAIHGKNIVLIDAFDGTVIDPLLGTLTPLNAGTVKGIRQIGSEVWITDQTEDVIYRFDLTQTYISDVSNNLDNIKGLDLVNGNEVWVTNSGSNNGAPGNAIVRYDTSGNHLGHFATGSMSPFDIVDDKNGNVYVSYSNGGSPIEVRDYTGNLTQTLVPGGTLNFGQQLDLTSSGDLLVANFSSPSGVYKFDTTTGTQLNFWSLSGVRGVIETGNGNILWSSSSGIHLLDTTSGTSTTLLSGSAQYFTRLNLNPGGCSDPTLSVTNPDAICEGETATITVTSNGDEVNWYDSTTATSPIHTGLSYTTSVLNATTSYWVEAVNYGTGGAPQQITGGARVAPSGNSGSTVNTGTAPWGLTFDADEDFKIISVDVYLTSATPGNLEMQLLDENWNVLDSATIPCPAGNSSNPVLFQVPLEFEVTTGNRYHLVAASGPAMIREFSSGHPGFPYPIDTVGTVVGGTINGAYTNNTVYYFFYNWTVEVGSADICTSDREEVVVTVNPIPDAPIGDANQDFVEGETLDDLDVTATGTLTWYEDADGTIELPGSTVLEDGETYYVSQTVDLCESPLLAITVNKILDISDFTHASVKIYPNPAADFFYVQSDQSIDEIRIFDMSGRLLKVKTNLSNEKVDWVDLSSGTYFVQLKMGTLTETVKVVKK